MISVLHLSPRHGLAQGCQYVLADYSGHGQPRHNSTFASFSSEIRHFHPDDESHASFRDLKRATSNEKARAGDWLRQRNLGDLIHYEATK